MSNYAAGRAPLSADPSPSLWVAALTTVIVGVVLLAGAAFVLSYAGIHQIALRAGVAPGPAWLYPLILDAMLMIAVAATLALRDTEWWPRAYAWASLLLLLAAVAAGDALYATNAALPAQPTRAVVAITPWMLLLLAFGLLLEMLRHFRRVRAVTAKQRQGVSGWRSQRPGQRVVVPWVSSGGAGDGPPPPPPGLDARLRLREGSPPAMPDASNEGQRTGGAQPAAEGSQPAAENRPGNMAQTGAAATEDSAEPG